MKSSRARLGGKAACSSALTGNGLKAPPTRVLTTDAFSQCLQLAGLRMSNGGFCDSSGRIVLPQEVAAVFEHILKSSTEAHHIQEEVASAIQHLDCHRLAIRSSSNLEDSAVASFAGMHRSHIWVPADAALSCIADCYASLWSRQVADYARATGIELGSAAMAVLLQPALEVRAAGVASTHQVGSAIAGILVEGCHGYGEGMVSGQLSPDTWFVNRTGTRIVDVRLGHEDRMVVPTPSGLATQPKPEPLRSGFCLSSEQVLEIASTCAHLAEQSAGPVQVEWAVDPQGTVWFLQVRPLISLPPESTSESVSPPTHLEPVLQGMPITGRCLTGHVFHFREDEQPPDDAILVLDNLDVSSLPALFGAQGLIVERGGGTSHASILLREQRVPAVVGAAGALATLTDGEPITLDLSGTTGRVWRGHHAIESVAVAGESIRRPRHRVCVVSSTELPARLYSALPLDGVGLARTEFLIWRHIGIAPEALHAFDAGHPLPTELADEIAHRSRGFQSAREWFIATLAGALGTLVLNVPGTIANIRLPDFTADDHLSLRGSPPAQRAGANPMIGWRGTTRLLNAPPYVLAWLVEAVRTMAEALHGDREVSLLVPFCRTPVDARSMRRRLEELGWQGRVGMMAEIPSNLLLAPDFADYFDYFLVGPMDLTQLVYGTDRTSPHLAHYTDEVDAVKELVVHMLHKLSDRDFDVFIGGWPLFQFLEEYEAARGKVTLNLVELPDRMRMLFDRVNELESRLART